ncbi:hypothetical protein D3H64_00770 [Atopobacter sp. AH10]|uniref:F0F1 ATP synthase subunit delta n=1 Tax=Atopobacter sp. AH10 TaxID=2315861 RepID=UPI000EF248D2|nr:F0F1 ATP synthase subunit delta [Atopobacter sp. AH10]RLK64094.1 hypothetical protein D3H64_00770 [Atopobacter sp. AH10]
MKKIRSVKKEVNDFYHRMVDSGRVEEVYQNVLALREGIGSIYKFEQTMQMEHIAEEDKAQFILSLTEGMTKEWKDFYLEMAYEYRFHYLGLVLQSFCDYYERHQLVIESVVPLKESEVNRIKEAIQKKLLVRFHHVTTELNPSLIGGLVVRSREYLMDGSIKRQLVDLRREMHQR